MATIPKGDLDVKLSMQDRVLLSQGIACRMSVLRRRINVEENQTIREVLDVELKQLAALSGRI